jgi:hypothetical protein
MGLPHVIAMSSMRTILVILAVALFVPSVSLSQDMELIKPGPLGRPSLVRGEGENGGNWYSPISVYSDADVELFVPENLTIGGVYWDGPSYKKDGTYKAYIYSLYKTDRDCRAHRIPAGHEKDVKWLQACEELRYSRRFVQVDTRKKTITVRQVILMESDGFPHPELIHYTDATIPLDGTVNPTLFQAVTRVTEMLERELRRHPEL